MAFKMKGSPMQRNFGIGGPMKKNGNGESEKKSSQRKVAETVIDVHKKAAPHALEAAMGFGGKILKTAGKALSKFPISFGTTKREA